MSFNSRTMSCFTTMGLTFIWAYRSMTGQEPEAKENLVRRVPWTTSKLTGTPEPPHPYKAERAFPNLAFREPVFMVRAPGLDRWFVGERVGKILSFAKDPAVKQADLFCDLPTEVKSWDPQSKVKRIEACYALVFHPQFPKKRTCYICYVLESKKDGEQLPDGTRISQFAVTDTDPPRIDPKSEKVLLTFMGGGHNGCDMHFGNDGMLYISTGDAANPNPPDKYDTGQDLSDLLSSILRIDVDKTDPGLNYAIPKDNPFVGLPKTRGEIWAYGFRNPWRMSFDRPTGDLWVGDVGWELYEMVDRIQKGGNYGWPIKEGNQDVRPSAKQGPTPLLPPTLAFPHTEAASITGGYVYHGKKFPELEGAYICGDYVTRKVWATKFDKDKIAWHKEIAQTNARVTSFGEDADGELYFIDHNDRAGIYTLAANPEVKTWTDAFPRKLSQTGLFTSAKDHTYAPGVEPFAIVAPAWMDGATAERFIALPGSSKAQLFKDPANLNNDFWSRQLYLPKDGVLGKTISMPMRQGVPASVKKLETQLLLYDGLQYRGFTYKWNDAQTDADLVGVGGENVVLDRTDGSAIGGRRRQTWHMPSRTECLTCHNPWAGVALAFTPLQLNRDASAASPLQSFADRGYLDLLQSQGRKNTKVTARDHPSIPGGKDLTTDDAARVYLHVNCSHCHQFGAGGTADLELRFTTPLSQTKTFNTRPVQGAFGIPDAKIIAPGDPNRSILYYRMAKTGHGRMPQLGSQVVDDIGVGLIREWIAQLDSNRPAAELLQKLDAIKNNPGLDEAEANKKKSQERTKIVQKLLESTDAALMLMRKIEETSSRNPVHGEAVTAALAHPNPLVRDLFERFATPEQRIERLGSNIDGQKLLALTGDIDRGRELFFAAGFQCGQCHQVAKKGGRLGPDLSDVAKRLSKMQIIESLLAPSKTIEAKYLTHAVETNAGVIHTGLLVEKTQTEMALRVLGDKEVRLPLTDILNAQTLQTSLMPDNLLRDATPRQAGDLLAYLWSLK